MKRMPNSAPPNPSLNADVPRAGLRPRSGRVLDVHTRDRSTDNLGDRIGKHRDLGFEFRALRRLPFEDGNEYRQLRRFERYFILSILITPNGTNTNPSVSGWRL